MLCKTCHLSNIYNVLCNLFQLCTHISPAPGILLMLHVMWSTKATMHLTRIVSIPIHKKNVVQYLISWTVPSNNQLGRPLSWCVLLMYRSAVVGCSQGFIPSVQKRSLQASLNGTSQHTWSLFPLTKGLGNERPWKGSILSPKILAFFIVSKANQIWSCNGTFNSRSFRQACTVINKD